VPILQFFAPFWPPEAKEAEIRLWCKLDKTPPEKQASVAELRGKTLQLENVPEATFELETQRGATASDPYRIIVTERHPPGGDLALVKVEMAPAPESIKRRYNYKTGTIGQYVLLRGHHRRGSRSIPVLFTANNKLAEGAIAAPRPLKVTVPRE